MRARSGRLQGVRRTIGWRRRRHACFTTAAGLAIAIGLAADAAEAQGGWGLQLVGDRWSSSASGMNLGAGVRRTGFFNSYVGYAIAASVIPVHLDTPELQNRATYLDWELGLLLRRPEWPVYGGWSIGYIYSASSLEAGSIGPLDSGAQILKLGAWLTDDLFVEYQEWFGATEQTLNGEEKGKRMVIVIGGAVRVE